MIKQYGIFFLRLLIVLGLYTILSNFIADRRIIIAVLSVIAIGFVIQGILKSKSYAGYLEVVLKPSLHYDQIEKYRDSNKDWYLLLVAYGKLYEGKYQEAEHSFSQISYQSVSSNPKLDFIYYVVKLGLLYNNKEIEEYKRTLDKAIVEKVFLKAKVNHEIFTVKQYVLEEDYVAAIDLEVLIIPKTTIRLFVVELEYLLAKSYFEINRLDDCNAVCEFISEKDYQVIYTELCRQLLVKMNRKVY